MPTSRIKNMLYRAALQIAVPNPLNCYDSQVSEGKIIHLREYEKLIAHYRVSGASLLLSSEKGSALVCTSVKGSKPIGQDSYFRVASITKIATMLAVMRLVDAGAFSLDTQVAGLLPAIPEADRLNGITIRHLLCHKSGLRDTPYYDQALRDGLDWGSVLKHPESIGSRPGETFAYCNFGFGLLGCVLEAVTGQPVSKVLREQVFHPLGMNATLEACDLDESKIVQIDRVLTRRPQPGIKITPLGRQRLDTPDPLRHFGHTAGAMYTDIRSLLRMMKVFTQNDGFISEAMMQQIFRVHAEYGAISPDMRYGLGMLLYEDASLPGRSFAGHQGFAYGCVDCAFIDRENGDIVLFLNGGAGEARHGRMGLVNRDVLRWAIGKELPEWK